MRTELSMTRPARRLLRLFGVTALLALPVGYWFGLRPILHGDGGVQAADGFEAILRGHAFEECARDSGIAHVHRKPRLDPKLEPIMNWVASVGAAAAAADYDGDGLVDLYVTNSRKGEPNYLYRNSGGGEFEEVAARVGLADVNDELGVSMDCVWGDYDNDGDPDLFVVQWGHDRLFRNEGGVEFADVTSEAFREPDGSAGTPLANGCSAIWFDFDGDSLLDIYVGNYFAPRDLWNLETTRILHDDFENARNAGPNSLYRNLGDGTFTDVAPALGLDDTGWTLSVGHGDWNNDGWPDLYCADDFGPDQLFVNRGDGSFENVSDLAIGPDTKKGMNVDCGDFDGDGWLDIHVANITTQEYLRECNMLWQHRGLNSEGVPLFEDVSVQRGVCDGGWGWGAKFFDFDNDGDLDLVGLNGFISDGEGSYWYDLASWTVTGDDVADATRWPPIGGRSFSGYESARLWRNEGGRFVEMADRAGIASVSDGRGVVSFDYDDDGDLDLYFANQGQAPELYRNDIGALGNYLALSLEGRPEFGSNRDAIGARVTIVTAAGRQIRELDGGNSYCAQSDRRLYFGLGDEVIVSELEVRWPSGRVQRLEEVAVNQHLRLLEAEGLERESTLIPREKRRGEATGAVAAASSPPLPIAEREALLDGIEDKLRQSPEDFALASRYRKQCARLLAYDRSIAFLETLARAHPRVPNLRLQLASAYIDKIPTCGGIAAVVCKGTLARQSLDQLDLLIEEDASWWPAVYSRATNHLHWPRALRHSLASAQDFEALIALQGTGAAASERSYYVRAHIGLGDAWAKHGDLEAARAAWNRGRDLFPTDTDLERRLGLLTVEEARAFVEEARSLEQAIDTDYSFIMLP